MARTRAPIILLVDDQPEHVLLVQKALERQDPQPLVRVAKDGKTALAMLEQELPDLVLLDLNMPGISGQDVLRAIRADPRFEMLPVTILSTSGRRADVEECFRLHANAYIEKPRGFRALESTMRTVVEHWFKTTLLPTSAE